ncbi:ABC transporter permease [Paenibacillus sp. E194]|uniref:ABC transporter permease n=1 Tax=Paenibacillus sp. E194 TaxID=1458845 RepID=UPI0005C994C0|nr:ABC transporter permease [Paenibacillus sp. E194]KJB86134.1 ABC transporter permease [Paenibacillus sp. E194]
MFLAIREMKHAKSRFMLIGLIMVLVACLTFIVSGLANGLSAATTSAIKEMNADYLVFQADSDNKLNRSSLKEEKLDEIRTQEGVTAAAPLIQTMLTVASEQADKKVDVALFAIEHNSILMPKVTEGRSLSGSGGHEVVVDASLKAKGVKLGDTLRIKDTDAVLKVVGFAEHQSISHMPVVFMDMDGLKSLMTSLDQRMPHLNAVAVTGDEAIKQTLTGKVEGIQLATKQEALKGIPGYKEEQSSLSMMLSFLVVIAAFVQAVFFYVITLQKTNQFGVLKAIGASTSYLATNLIGQVALLAIVSVALSIGLTFGMTSMFPDTMPFELGVGVLAPYSALLIGVSIVGALLSLRRIAKVDAIEAIGRVE